MGSQGCILRVGLTLFTTIVTLITSAEAAATPSKLHIDPVDISGCPNLKVFVGVENEAGNPVRGIAPTGFAADVGGQAVAQVEAKPFAKSGEGLAVALVLDTSGSMKGEPLAAQNQAASAFIQSLKPADRVAVITFGNSVQVVRAFSKPAPDIRRQVESLAAGGEPVSSKLFDSIYQALDEVRDASGLPSRRAVVVISDGKDVGSSVTLEDCQRLAKVTHSPIYAIGYSRMKGTKRRNYLANLSRLSQLTGGYYQEAPETTSLAGLYQDLVRRLKGRYVLRFLARGLSPDGKQRELRVSLTVPSGKLTKVRAFTIPKNQTCPPPPAPPPPVEQGLPKKTKILIAVGGGAALLLLVLVVFMVRRSRIQQALEARTCPYCEQLKPEGMDTCPTCEAQSYVGSGNADVTVVESDEAPADDALAQLLVLSGGPADAKGYTFNLTNPSTTIGRDQERCQVLLPDDQVSTVHAGIYLVDGGFEVHDLNSANGTQLNGERIEKAALAHGDELILGSMKFRFLDRRQ